MQEIRDCPAALKHARELHVDIYVHDTEDESLLQSTPDPEIPQLFASVLSSMPNLARLDFGVSDRATPAFQNAFEEANVILPSLKYLQPGAHSHWLLGRCPNLEVLEAGSYFHHWSWNTYDRLLSDAPNPLEALVDAAKGLPLKKLKLRAGRPSWNPKMLESKCLSQQGKAYEQQEADCYLKRFLMRHQTSRLLKWMVK